MAKRARVYDVVIIGAGHNGLVCAGYLARHGLKVMVVERRGVVGGAAITEEFHPGFRNSVASYVVSLLDRRIIADLKLEKFGLEILDRPAGTFLPQPDGRYLHLSRDRAVAKAEVAKFHGPDGDAYEAFDAEITALAEAVRPLLREPPIGMPNGISDAFRVLGLTKQLRKMGGDQQAKLAEIMTMSVGDYLDRWFEGDAVKGAFGFEGIIGNLASPYHPGTAYVLLHHAFGETDGRTSAWGHAKGGMGAITEAMARSAETRGAIIVTESPVREVIIEGKNGETRAAGVVLEDGRTIHARRVAANVNPKLLFLDLMDPAVLPDDFRKRMENWRCRSGTFRMNLALSRLPRFACLRDGGGPELLNGTIDIAPSLGYLDRAYDAAKSGGWSPEPIVSMCIPSLIDDTLAPSGAHVMSLFCQHFHPTLADGRSWDKAKYEVADAVLRSLEAYMPNLRQLVVGRQILTPLDLERDFGLVGGDIFHGAMHLDQLYAMRPALGHADHRMPVKGLYLCGAGAHPGGGVSGIPGRNAARAILKDTGR
ncbi:MAG: NAD(P)/FAD-dependent oxidoreductase [Alphaproteobacteria bacterium]